MSGTDQRRPSADMMAGMAEQFMSNWTSDVFRERCVAQIETVRNQTNPQPNTGDPVENFLAEKSAADLEQFVFEKSKTRDEYMSYVADMIMMLRQHAGHPAVNAEVLKNADPGMLAQMEASINGGLNGSSGNRDAGAGI